MYMYIEGKWVFLLVIEIILLLNMREMGQILFNILWGNVRGANLVKSFLGDSYCCSRHQIVIYHSNFLKLHLLFSCFIHPIFLHHQSNFVFKITIQLFFFTFLLVWLVSFHQQSFKFLLSFFFFFAVIFISSFAWRPSTTIIPYSRRPLFVPFLTEI